MINSMNPKNPTRADGITIKKLKLLQKQWQRIKQIF